MALFSLVQPNGSYRKENCLFPSIMIECIRLFGNENKLI